jgi:DNA mismatch repair ATPase MutS
VTTAGGRKLMDSMFQFPLTSADEINKRSGIFRYFAAQSVTFPFSADEFGLMENYLGSGAGGNILSIGLDVLSKKALQVVAQDKTYEELNDEVCRTIALLGRLEVLANHLPDIQDSPYRDQLEQIRNIFNHPRLGWLERAQGVSELPLSKLIKYDYQLRSIMHEHLQELLTMIYYLDVYIAVSRVGKQRGYTYANAVPKGHNNLTINNFYHPAVDNAIGNTLSLHADSNVISLTGANMAGKSTLMKSFGISIYLAHMGFPVAADKMEFSVKDGLYTSINVPDNLELGYSHFYAEVLRVKTVAEQVAEGKDLVVIFDELFKGTNVKDAYDATLSITEAFSENRNCFFMISTHITEVGEALRERCSNFRFTYLPTVMVGVIPQYTYRLTEGITPDRHGMRIIENEGILDIIRSGNKQPNEK